MTSSRDRNTPGWLIPVAAGLLAALSAAGGTFALWHDEARPGPEFISTGRLGVTALAEPVWQDTSNGAPQGINPETFRVRTGDTLRVSIPVETTVDGTNLTAQLAVQLAADATLPAGVHASYTLHDAAGMVLTPTGLALGEVTDVTPDDGAHYTVHLDLDFTDYSETEQLTAFRGIDVIIAQVRDEADAS